MNLNIDFPVILTALVIISGLIVLIDRLFFAKKRKAAGKKLPILVDYSRSFFPILLLVLIIRSFVFQPYRVPTGSLEPTIIPGDFIGVSQFSYGLRLPIVNTKIMNIGEPKTGDITLFRFPKNPKVNFVKRMIGVPGDHVVYKNKILTINGKIAQQTSLGPALDIEPGREPIAVERRLEDLNGVKHEIFVRPVGGETEDVDVVVPKGMFFVMGDNRDNSDDSRSWGFVPEANLIGKAFGIWMSWDADTNRIRWERIGKGIH